MKTVNIREARGSIADLVADAQKEPVCLTKYGRPVAVITGVEGKDLATVALENSPEFWEEIERRRASKRPRVSMAEVKKRFGVSKDK